MRRLVDSAERREKNLVLRIITDLRIRNVQSIREKSLHIGERRIIRDSGKFPKRATLELGTLLETPDTDRNQSYADQDSGYREPNFAMTSNV